VRVSAPDTDGYMCMCGSRRFSVSRTAHMAWASCDSRAAARSIARPDAAARRAPLIRCGSCRRAARRRGGRLVPSAPPGNLHHHRRGGSEDRPPTGAQKPELRCHGRSSQRNTMRKETSPSPTPPAHGARSLGRVNITNSVGIETGCLLYAQRGTAPPRQPHNRRHATAPAGTAIPVRGPDHRGS
jgi:hypothetical protein